MVNYLQAVEMTMSSIAGSESNRPQNGTVKLTASGRIGQSVLQQGDEVPRGVSKWTKRNHTAAVKVGDLVTRLYADR